MKAWLNAFPEIKPLGDPEKPDGWAWPVRMGGMGRMGGMLGWKGARALVTPPWSLDIDAPNAQRIVEHMAACKVPIQILDLPAGVALPAGFKLGSVCAHPRHTRQIKIEGYALPKKRAQQARRALRDGVTVEAARDVLAHIELHQAARQRKGIASDAQGLRTLMTTLLKDAQNLAYIAFHNERPIASAIVVRSETPLGRTALYALGGQDRAGDKDDKGDKGTTARASVAVLAQAIEDARANGDQIFDFGGSSDPGVDRFYAEFGAHIVPKLRLVKTAGWIRPILALKRPDLAFPKPVPSS
jgi:hypothetical protein